MHHSSKCGTAFGDPVPSVQLREETVVLQNKLNQWHWAPNSTVKHPLKTKSPVVQGSRNRQGYLFTTWTVYLNHYVPLWAAVLKAGMVWSTCVCMKESLSFYGQQFLVSGLNLSSVTYRYVIMSLSGNPSCPFKQGQTEHYNCAKYSLPGVWEVSVQYYVLRHH